MTPAQEAKEFAAAHDIVIRPVGRRYAIFGPNSELIDEVGGYPAALNAMKRWVCDNAFPEGWKAVDTSVEEGEIKVPDAGAPTLGNDSQCVESVVGAAVIGEVLARGSYVSAVLKTHGVCFEAVPRPGPERGPFASVPGPKWRVWQKDVTGTWRPLMPFRSRAEAVKFCRQVASGSAALRNLAREIRYEV